MSETALLRRIVSEHRRLLLPLAVALVVNGVAYVSVVRPLALRVANIAERDASAERALASARQQHATASETSTGKDRAAQELERFYADVLPRDLAAARRLTHVRVPQLADQFNVTFYSATVSPPSQARDSTLVRFVTRVDLGGRYADVRNFVHALETAPEFVVIDDVSLTEEDAEGGQLQLALQLSTYYQVVE